MPDRICSESMFSPKCPKCFSSQIRRGYRPTPIWSKIFGRYNLLCDNCNLEFWGFAIPGTVETGARRKRKRKPEETSVSAPLFSRDDEYLELPPNEIDPVLGADGKQFPAVSFIQEKQPANSAVFNAIKSAKAKSIEKSHARRGNRKSKKRG